MNFNCVGTDKEGRMYMKFNKPFNTVTKIQLLQRWILVESYIYYELNDNIVSDHIYDANARQLTEMILTYPEEAKRSCWYPYFYDWVNEDGESCSSGFQLIERVRTTELTESERARFKTMLGIFDSIYNAIRWHAELALESHIKKDTGESVKWPRYWNQSNFPI